MGVKLEITQEKLDKLEAVINSNKDRLGPLMPTLHETQKIFGCVPIPIQKIISQKLNISIAEINGVVTFYSQFSIEPKGKHIVGVCLGTACYVRGSQEILDVISAELKIKAGETSEDGLYTLQATRCIGACGLAPVFTVGEDVYGNTNATKAKEAIKKYLE